MGLQPDGTPWAIAIEKPDLELRSAHAVVALENAAIATSGDYRHWIDVGGTQLSHTMDPRRGGPLPTSPASVTVVAETCMAADAFATVLMVMGVEKGKTFAAQHGMSAVFLMRDGNDLSEVGMGSLFVD